MCKRAKQCWVALAVAFAFSAVLGGAVRADEAQDQKMLDALKKGIELYQTGDYAGAKAQFGQVLAMEPGNAAALKMADMADMAEFFKMEDKEQLKDEASRLLDLMARAQRQQKRTIPDVEQTMKDFASPELTVYVAARIKLTGHGPYAVPYLVPLLTVTPADQQWLVARAETLLGQLQRDACLPLIRVLLGTDDTLLKARVAVVLGHIGDARAVPALMAVLESPNVTEDVKAAAMRAAEAITGKDLKDLGSAAEQYALLGSAYLVEDKATVGFTYGTSADVWQWYPAGSDLTQKVTYVEVPDYLYYQRMAAEVVLEGMALAPADEELRALLGAALVRELALCEYFKTADLHMADKEAADKVKQDASDRAAKFEVQVPVVLRLLQLPVAARVLDMLISVNDGEASLYVVRTLGDKLTAEGPGALDQQSTNALVAALDSGDKDVRYNAATVLVSAAPMGDPAFSVQAMDVMSAALKAAADRTALVAMDNFQMRNNLVTLLRSLGMATTECDTVQIEHALSVQPSVDIVFLTGNLTETRFAGVMRVLREDPRTKAVPLYVVVDPAAAAPDMANQEGVTAVITPDDLREAKLQPVLEKEVLAKSRSAFTEQEQAIVLKAARALVGVDPLTTSYPLEVVEPSLIKALTGYGADVTAAVEAALEAFGSAESVEPLSKVVAASDSVDLKIGACRAMAAVMKRAGATATEDEVAVLRAALAGQDQALRQAAAEALGEAGLSPEDQMALIRKDGLGL